MTDGRYSSGQTQSRLVTVLLVLLILFMAATAFLAGFLVGQRNCNAHDHGTPAAAVPDMIYPTGTTEATEPVEKNQGRISIPGFEVLELQAGVQQQTVVLSNPAENTCLFRISLILEDGTVLWTSQEVQPGQDSDPIFLSQPLGAGEFPNAKVKYECFAQDEERTPLNGAETKLTLKVK